MITEATTKVYVRVDAATRRVIGVSDEQLITREGKPVFTVASNSARLDHYIVESNTSAANGFTVRPATAAEKTAADATIASAAATSLAKAKQLKALAILALYDGAFIYRFITRGFMTTAEVTSAAAYAGTDDHMVNVVKPLAITITDAYNEWRHGVCQPVIDAMYADAGMGVELDEAYRTTVQDELDTFLTDKGFDVAIYHR